MKHENQNKQQIFEILKIFFFSILLVVAGAILIIGAPKKTLKKINKVQKIERIIKIEPTKYIIIKK